MPPRGLKATSLRSVDDDDDAKGAVLIVPHHQDHCVVEARIAHLRRSNQQLTCERRALRGFFGRRQGRIEERRWKKNRCDDHAKRREPNQAHGFTSHTYVTLASLFFIPPSL